MMTQSISPATNLTLLSRVKQLPTDQAAWTQFADCYGRMIQNWSRRWGLGPHDAEDLSQKVLLELSQQMMNFQYDPKGSIPAWLKTIAYRAWCDCLERRRRHMPETCDPAVLEMLPSREDRDHFWQRIDEEWNWERLAEAMRAVKARVQPHTWKAFRLMTHEGLSGQEAADILNMKVGTVWVAKSKVQKMIVEEARKRDHLDRTI